MNPNKCSGTRARDGQPCGAPAVKDGKCAGHAGLGIAATDPQEGARLANAVRREKASYRAMNAQDHLAAQLEANAQTIVQAVIKAASEGDTQMIRFAYERAYGKPIERIEQVTTGLNPGQMSDAQRAELRRQLVAEHPELLELVPRAKPVIEPKEDAKDA